MKTGVWAPEHPTRLRGFGIEDHEALLQNNDIADLRRPTISDIAERTMHMIASETHKSHLCVTFIAFFVLVCLEGPPVISMAVCTSLYQHDVPACSTCIAIYCKSGHLQILGFMGVLMFQHGCACAVLGSQASMTGAAPIGSVLRRSLMAGGHPTAAESPHHPQQRRADFHIQIHDGRLHFPMPCQHICHSP